MAATTILLSCNRHISKILKSNNQISMFYLHLIHLLNFTTSVMNFKGFLILQFFLNFAAFYEFNFYNANLVQHIY